MKHNMLFQILICTLIISSALYVKYRKDTETVSAMADTAFSVTHGSTNMTFSDLAEKVLNQATERTEN